MMIFDAHLDLAWNALGWNRDLGQTVAQIRLSEVGMNGKGRGANTVAFPEMRQGRVGIALVNLLARCDPRGRSALDFRTQEIASAIAQGQLAYYRLLEKRGICRILRDWPSLKESFSAWDSGRENAPFGFILSMEGADPIVSPGNAIEWYKAGLRVIGLAHYGPSAYAHGTGSEGGLALSGRELLRVMEEVGLTLDLTHLSDLSFWEASRQFRGSVLASHNCCRSITPGDRQNDDDQIRLIIERDGIIGTPFDAKMMVPGWNLDPAKSPTVTLQSAVQHIDHICQLAGNTRHVGIGSDLDGNFGLEQSPQDLNTIADLQKLVPLLHQRGYTESDVSGIMHGNWMRFFERTWNR